MASGRRGPKSPGYITKNLPKANVPPPPRGPNVKRMLGQLKRLNKGRRG